VRKKKAAEQEALRKKAEERRAASFRAGENTPETDVATVKAGIEKLKRKHEIVEVKARQTGIAIENLKIIMKRDTRRIDRIKSADNRYFKDFQRRLGSLESILKSQSALAQFQSSSSLTPRSTGSFRRGGSPRSASIK